MRLRRDQKRCPGGRVDVHRARPPRHGGSCELRKRVCTPESIARTYRGLIETYARKDAAVGATDGSEGSISCLCIQIHHWAPNPARMLPYAGNRYTGDGRTMHHDTVVRVAVFRKAVKAMSTRSGRKSGAPPATHPDRGNAQRETPACGLARYEKVARAQGDVRVSGRGGVELGRGGMLDLRVSAPGFAIPRRWAQRILHAGRAERVLYMRADATGRAVVGLEA